MRVVDCETTEEGRTLVVVAEDGCRRALSAGLLWSECPSAAGRVRRIHGRSQAPEHLLITAVRPVGSYGVNIAFSDGHNRGIYPWSYLAMLAARPQINDFLIA